VSKWGSALNKREKHITSYAGHAPLLAKQAIQSGCTKLLAVGGDGTIGEVSQALMDTETVLGIIPAGTGNDYIKSLNISSNIEEAIQIALTGIRETVDVIRVNSRACLNIASIGIDASTAYYANRCKHLRGQFAYIYGLALAFFKAKLPEFTFSIDGGSIQHAACTLAVFANGQYYGGGFRPVPIARHNDGILDVLMIDKLPRLKMLPLMVSYAKGKHVDWNICHFHRCQSIEIHSGCMPLIINVDGEIMVERDIHIQLIPHSLSVSVPPKGA